MPSSILNSDDGVISGTSGLKSTGGDDGVLNIQSNGTTVAAVNGSGVTVTGTLSASGGYGAVSASSLTVNSNNISADNSLGFRNRILNGCMRIDQRNAGAAVTINTTANIYTLDRWAAVGQLTDGVFTVDQVTDVPANAGFTNSTKVTVTTADASIGATQLYLFSQFIEGNNFADAMFGTANAKTITVSFWTRSSLTGTFGGALNNSANDRSYPFTYTINSADTWEYKTVTVAGDTTGTWLTDTGRGISLRFSLGTGSTYSGTAGSWSGSTYYSATGAVSVIGTLNATWYITGVQLEVGSVATPFERRPYGQELSLCQRYYQILQNASGGRAESTTYLNMPFRTLCTMRATPSGSIVGTIVVRDLSAGATRTANTPGSLGLSIANDTGGYLEFGASSWSPGNFTIGNLCALACSTGINGIALASEL